MNILRRALPYLGIAVILAIAYDGGIFYSRWNYAREAEKAALQQQAREARHALDLLGGDRLKILNFYASPGAIRRGQRALICYGVNQAERVRMEPPVEQLHPALSHCLEVSPLRDTAYKLIAEDRDGHVVTETLSIKVAPY